MRRLLLERGVAAGIASKILQGGAGPITALLIVHYFEPAAQGYFYTFGSLVAAQIVVELGLAGIITNFAAHEFSSLQVDGAGRVQGDARARARLAALVRFAVRWYALAALCLLPLLLAGGLLFMSAGAHAAVAWRAPWIALCVCASAGFVLTPAWAVLSGCGQIAVVNRYKVFETLVRALVTWAMIALGASLWSLVAANVAVFSCGLAFLAGRYRTFFASVLAAPGAALSWHGEIRPLQRRVALVWASGYATFSLFTPITFHFLGPEEAGRVGMTWVFVSGLSSLAGTWLQVRSPQFSMMVASRNFAALDALFRRTAWLGAAVAAIGGAAGIAALLLARELAPAVGARFLGPGPVMLYFVAEALHQVSMAQSTYLRAFKREPFVWIAACSALVTAGGTILLTPRAPGWAPAVSYFAGVVIALAWGSAVFRRSRTAWIARGGSAA